MFPPKNAYVENTYAWIYSTNTTVLGRKPKATRRISVCKCEQPGRVIATKTQYRNFHNGGASPQHTTARLHPIQSWCFSLALSLSMCATLIRPELWGMFQEDFKYDSDKTYFHTHVFSYHSKKGSLFPTDSSHLAGGKHINSRQCYTNLSCACYWIATRMVVIVLVIYNKITCIWAPTCVYKIQFLHSSTSRVRFPEAQIDGKCTHPFKCVCITGTPVDANAADIFPRRYRRVVY